MTVSNPPGETSDGLYTGMPSSLELLAFIKIQLWIMLSLLPNANFFHENNTFELLYSNYWKLTSKSIDEMIQMLYQIL